MGILILFGQREDTFNVGGKPAGPWAGCRLSITSFIEWERGVDRDFSGEANARGEVDKDKKWEDITEEACILVDSFLTFWDKER